MSAQSATCLGPACSSGVLLGVLHAGPGFEPCVAYCGSEHLALAHARVTHYEHVHIGARPGVQRACINHIGLPSVSHMRLEPVYCVTWTWEGNLCTVCRMRLEPVYCASHGHGHGTWGWGVRRAARRLHT